MDRAARLSDPDRIREAVTRLGVTRLAHLTPFRNLVHIAAGDGLLSVSELNDDERKVFDQQDLHRFDGHPDHICCSIEYPNVWYLRQRRVQATPLQRLFPDWVCLLIDRSHLWEPETCFCHRNAAAGGGVFIRSGIDGFLAMFDDPVEGSQGSISRGLKPSACPTDDQAEVLVHKQIPIEHANHVVVADAEQAARVYVGLELTAADVDAFQFTIAPDMFSTSLSTILRSGSRPDETPWTPEDLGAIA